MGIPHLGIPREWSSTLPRPQRSRVSRLSALIAGSVQFPDPWMERSRLKPAVLPESMGPIWMASTALRKGGY